MSAVVDEAGQIVIPEDIRQRLGLAAGSVVDFNVANDGRAYIEKRRSAAERVAALKSLVETLKTDMTTDEIMSMTRGDD